MSNRPVSTELIHPQVRGPRPLPHPVDAAALGLETQGRPENPKGTGGIGQNSSLSQFAPRLKFLSRAL